MKYLLGSGQRYDQCQETAAHFHSRLLSGYVRSHSSSCIFKAWFCLERVNVFQTLKLLCVFLRKNWKDTDKYSVWSGVEWWVVFIYLNHLLFINSAKPCVKYYELHYTDRLSLYIYYMHYYTCYNDQWSKNWNLDTYFPQFPQKILKFPPWDCIFEDTVPLAAAGPGSAQLWDLGWAERCRRVWHQAWTREWLLMRVKRTSWDDTTCLSTGGVSWRCLMMV